MKNYEELSNLASAWADSLLTCVTIYFVLSFCVLAAAVFCVVVLLNWMGL